MVILSEETRIDDPIKNGLRIKERGLTEVGEDNQRNTRGQPEEEEEGESLVVESKIESIHFLEVSPNDVVEIINAISVEEGEKENEC